VLDSCFGDEVGQEGADLVRLEVDKFAIQCSLDRPKQGNRQPSHRYSSLSEGYEARSISRHGYCTTIGEKKPEAKRSANVLRVLLYLLK
jgi:hypothetical protein